MACVFHIYFSCENGMSNDSKKQIVHVAVSSCAHTFLKNIVVCNRAGAGALTRTPFEFRTLGFVSYGPLFYFKVELSRPRGQSRESPHSSSLISCFSSSLFFVCCVCLSTPRHTQRGMKKARKDKVMQIMQPTGSGSGRQIKTCKLQDARRTEKSIGKGPF